MSILNPVDISNSFTQHFLNYQTALNLMHDYFPVTGNLNEASQTYTNAENAVITEQAQIFTLENRLATSANLVNANINAIKQEINVLDASTNNIESILNNFKDRSLAAEGELKIQKYLYHELFTGNIILVLTVIIFAGVIFKSIKKKSN